MERPRYISVGFNAIDVFSLKSGFWRGQVQGALAGRHRLLRYPP
jgi:hypothetical protein